jgi:hypothetical protein
MYYVFQQQSETSAVLFTESCETEAQMEEAVNTAPYPVMFTYDDVSQQISIITPYYDLGECRHIIKQYLNK